MALEASVKQAMAAKLAEMKPQMDEAIGWIQAVTNETMEGTFDEWLRDGQVLCRLINTLSPGAVKKVNAGKLAFKQMENVSNFIRACKKLGMHESDCFDTNDLYTGNDIGKVVMTIHSLGSLAQSKIPGWSGPAIGVKLAEKNAREFTAEQLAASKMATSKLTCGSSATMERTGVMKTGITFGNDQSGSGDGSATSKLTVGSSEKMERTGIMKTGITFGNDQSGSGDGAAVSKLTVGSSERMERSGVMKTGITFGNDQAGAGMDGVSKMTSGSAGTMERSEIKKPGITFGHDSA